MCGFAGFADMHEDLLKREYLWGEIGKVMANKISHRGPDQNGLHITKNSVLAHARLSVMDPALGKQPMTFTKDSFSYTIAYNGEIYNTNELKADLKLKGYTFETNCDTEVLLKTYIEYGEKCPEKLNGIFSFVIDDGKKDRIFLCRDRFGVKPFFYSFFNQRLLFSSEIKGILQYPNIKATINKEGISQIFGIGPAKISGSGVFKDILELKPAHFAIYNKNGFSKHKYFSLQAYEMDKSYDEATDYVSFLLDDIAKRQIVSDVPLCTFLSGGLDSSVVTALAKKYSKGTLHTYSFDYQGNNEFFTPTSYEPSADEPWARKVSAYLNTEHTTLICDTASLYNSLFDAVNAKDLPGMADIDSSLLYFCKKVKENHVVALCGECADEIFDGYPWFLNKEQDGFPWSRDMDFRTSMLNEDLCLDLKSYSKKLYDESISNTPLIGHENADDLHWRKMTYLNIQWFMQTLLDRKDRCSMYSGLEVRVPYADHRLVEFLYNCPHDYKNRNGVNKSILRDACKDLLPNDILYRKKKPYPKTHNPNYEMLLKNNLSKILDETSQPLHKIISVKNAKQLLNENFDYGKPWFGQLMAGPQLIAYLIQINYWLKNYDINLEL
ncbi:MAG: asparagine synthase (glutamine-hydrolyzing) [Clostridia bacterium]